MLAVQCGGAGNRLKEVRICFTRSGEFRACGRNENQRRLCSADRMYVPPVRYGAAKE
jgi:ribonuclease T2